MTGLEFLYHTLPGRFLLKGLTMPQLSKACGRFLDEEASAFLIPLFVKKTGIDVSEYDTENIHSFNDFFSRKILEGRRPVDLDPTHLIAPCVAHHKRGNFSGKAERLYGVLPASG